MDLRHARAFIAVAEELHFGRAAERLHVAQPPLSRMIRQLEADLGAELFERTTHWVRLTQHGEAVLGPMRELVRLAEQMPDTIRRSLAGDIGRVRLGYGDSAVDVSVGLLASALREERPGIHLELESSQFGHLGLDRLNDDTLDLLLARLDVVPPEYESVLVAEEELLIALPAGHPLAEREALAATELAHESWVVLPGGTATGRNRLSLLSVEGGFVPRVVQSAPDASTLLLLVSAGVGVAPTLSSVSARYAGAGVVFRPLTPAPAPIQVRLIWRAGDPNPALGAVIELARSTLS